MNLLVLDTTSKVIEAQIEGAHTTTAPVFTAHYADASGSGLLEQSVDGELSGATPVTIVAAPALNVRRIIREITIYNLDTAAHTLTVAYNAGTARPMITVVLEAGQSWHLSDQPVRPTLALIESDIPASIARVTDVLPRRVTVTTPWTTAAIARTDIEAALGIVLSHELADRTLLVHLAVGVIVAVIGDGETFHVTHAPVLGVTTDIENPPASAGWKIAPLEPITAGATVYVIGLSSFNQASTDEATTAASSAVSAHTSATDPHGDRQYANDQDAAVLSEAEGIIDTQIGNHAAATDPHGDRAYTNGAIDDHNSDSEVHSAINSRFDQAGTAASEVSTHNSSATAHANIRSGVVVPLSKPSLISWSWVNQGAGVRHDAADHISLVVEASGGTTTYLMRALETALADGGSFEVTACLKNLGQTTINPWGLYVRNDSILYSVGALNAIGVKVDSRTAMSGVAPSSVYNGTGTVPMPLWFRISRVGNDLLIYVSLDGQAWALIRTIVDAALTPMTACGFYSEIRASTGVGIIECDSFSIVA